ncbi:MAG: 2-isopropylmalate synthase [candidate division WS1 bacterium]|nr:2-isopropylmalate synthase [candidate division WS1 bacterium]
MPRQVKIFDTTLRDGEQSPGASLNTEQKITIARQLAALKVDIIEAGFPHSSPEDLHAVSRIAQEVHGPVICGLARAMPADIEDCWKAVQYAEKPRIHTFIGTSNIHIEKKLRKSKPEVLKMAVEGVKLACSLCPDVEFSAEDAMRTDLDYLAEVVAAAIEAGAQTINVPDTVGYTMPWIMAETLAYLYEQVPALNNVTVSVHCHNDLGMATANSLAAVQAGAGQVECTVNGMGERAGNASLEEVVMALKTRVDVFGCETGVDTREIIKASRMVSSLCGFPIQPNKAVVGANAFAHEAGIHQHGMIMDRETYEIMKPEDVGLTESVLTLGPRSGRHGLSQRLGELGYEISGEKLDEVYQRFLAVADRKKQVYDEDLAVIMQEAGDQTPETWRLISLQVVSGSAARPTATVRLAREDAELEAAEIGNGPVDAAYAAINRLISQDPEFSKKTLELEDYAVRSVSLGTDALGEATVRVRRNGEEAVGRAASTDVVEASAKAYLNALNRLMIKERRAAESPGM